MKIKEIIRQHRRDFHAIYECENCGNTKEDYGYDDDYFHNKVIPEMKCSKCSKTANTNYRPLKPRYQTHEVI